MQKNAFSEESGIIYYIGFIYFRASSLNGGSGIRNKFGGSRGGRMSNKQSHSIVENIYHACFWWKAV